VNRTLKHLWETSYSHAWAGIQGIAGASFIAAPYLNQLLTNADIKTGLVAFGIPDWTGHVMLILAGVTYVVSSHKDV
jgi:hypothetical protein